MIDGASYGFSKILEHFPKLNDIKAEGPCYFSQKYLNANDLKLGSWGIFHPTLLRTSYWTRTNSAERAGATVISSS